MKTTEEVSKQTLCIDGTLLNVILDGGLVVDYRFTGWGWYVLIKHPKGKFKVTDDRQFGKREFQYTQFQTLDEGGFYEAVHHNGTPREVLGKFTKDFYEEKFLKQRAYELGNIK